MNEQTAWTHTSSITAIIQSVAWTTGQTYMYLELIPLALLHAKDIHTGIRLEHYDATTPFDNWRRGRVFDTHQEVKWEWYNGSFHIVSCGKQIPQGLTAFPLNAARVSIDNWYYIWGTQTDNTEIRAMQPNANAAAFVELQIPRILSYPVSENAWRVQIHMKEFYASNGALCYTRWCGLKEVIGSAGEDKDKEEQP